MSSRHEAHTTHVRQRPEWEEHRASVYPRLNAPGSEIRLMHLDQADDYNADVSIRLSIANLEDSPTFYAVSLVWGDPTKTRRVYLEGVEYLVTVNQEDALRNLRRRPTYQVAALWMDVVCINQTDREERQLMVGIMDRIYRASVRTLVWLVEPSTVRCRWLEERIMDKASKRLNEDGTFEDCASRVIVDHEPFRQACERDWIDGALWILQRLGEDAHFWELPFFHKQKTEQGEYKFSRQWKLACQFLEQLLSLPYWSRVWVIQELVLSPQDPEIHMGTRTLSFSRFHTAAAKFTDHWMGCCKMLTPWWMVDDLISVMHNLRVLHKYQVDYSQNKLSVCAAVMWAKRSNATDPRDHIYGVLGLTKLRERIPVDYSLSTFQVFAEYQWKVIHLIGNMGDIWEGAKHSRYDELKPTWVADCTKTGYSDDFASSRSWTSISRTKSPDPGPYTYEPQMGLLQLPAHKWDTIKQCRYGGSLPPLWDQQGLFACSELLQTEQKFRQLLQDEMPMIETGKYWEVILTGCYKQGGGWIGSETDPRYYSFGQAFSQEQCKTLEGLLDFFRIPRVLTEVKKMGRETYDIVRHIEHSLGNVAFFTTKGGCIGSGELNLRSDDEIFELYGCGLPTILRRWQPDESYGIDKLMREDQDGPVEETTIISSVNGDYYAVVGPCYLSEHMGHSTDGLDFFDQDITLY